ncbi:MAG: acetyltransferase GNAT family protein [Podoviridae sp. ctbj_2]|nr:MAG: acetyltransferase GNAT family protein [Podoviridae sp. ctbj_2]
MYTVGSLTHDNYVWSVEVAATRMLLEEVKRPELLNKENIYRLVDKMIVDDTAIICMKDDKPVGCIGALLVPNTYNPDIATLAELIWYVLPEHRKGRAGFLLLEQYIKMAEELADEATLSLLKSSEVNFESLAKRGFHQEEYAFRMSTKG